MRRRPAPSATPTGWRVLVPPAIFAAAVVLAAMPPTAPRAQAVPNSGSDVVDQCAESGGDYEDQGTFHGKHYERCCYKATPFANAYCIQFVNGTQVSVGKETSASTPPPPPPPVFTPPTANAPAQ